MGIADDKAIEAGKYLEESEILDGYHYVVIVVAPEATNVGIVSSQMDNKLVSMLLLDLGVSLAGDGVSVEEHRV